jgi:type IV fimbrial biogenesis protein FimT
MTELMVTMVVVGILMAVAVPSMTQFMADRAAGANADEFAEALRFARSEALKRGRPVKMCATEKPEQTDPTCSGKKTWDKGWLIVFDDSGRVLRVQNALRAMNATEPVTAASDEIVFASTGIVLEMDEPSETYTFNPVGDSGSDGYADRVRTVTVTQQGRVKVTKGS